MEQNEKGCFAENAGDILEAEPFDPLAAGDMPEIREMPSYENMRDEAVAQYRQNRKANLIFLCIGIVGLTVSFCIFWELIISGGNILFLIVALFVLFFAAWCISCIKKFSDLKRDYRYRLNRAVEIMSNANVFMQVPKEDLERFDKWYL